MCNPMIIAVVGTVLQAYQTNQQGKAAAAQLDHQGDVAEFNGRIGENNAVAAKQAAEYEADLFDEGVRRRLATNRTLTAKSGVVINTGSADLVQTDSLENAALERLAILYNGQVNANAALTGAANDRFQGAAARANAKAARVAGRINTGVSIANSAFTMQQQGLLSSW